MRSRFALLMAILLAALSPTAALANMANPVQPGALLAEPSAELADVAIEGETLTFDARPLATSKNVTVEAIYHLRNDGADGTVPIVFVAAAAGRKATAWMSFRGAERRGISAGARWTSARVLRDRRDSSRSLPSSAAKGSE
jgi:hypothetical protein